METKKTFTRREISVQAALALLGGATITLMGCGGSSGGSDPTPTPSPTPVPDKSATSISANHGHTAVITSAQLTAGGGLSLSIQGTSAHDHTFDLTGAEVVQIREGTAVTKTSALVFGHTHDIRFN